MTVAVEPANVVASTEREGGIGAGTFTIYTVPAEGKFFLTNATLSHALQNIAGHYTCFMTVTPKNGAAAKLLTHAINGVLATPVTTAVNLQNPIELEPESLITFTTTQTNMEGAGTIVGYTSD